MLEKSARAARKSTAETAYVSDRLMPDLQGMEIAKMESCDFRPVVKKARMSGGSQEAMVVFTIHVQKEDFRRAQFGLG